MFRWRWSILKYCIDSADVFGDYILWRLLIIEQIVSAIAGKVQAVPLLRAYYVTFSYVPIEHIFKILLFLHTCVSFSGEKIKGAFNLFTKNVIQKVCLRSKVLNFREKNILLFFRIMFKWGLYSDWYKSLITWKVINYPKILMNKWMFEPLHPRLAA